MAYFSSVERFICFFRSELAFSLFRAFLARTIAAFGVIILAVVVGRAYGPSGVGTVALAQAVLLGSGIFCKFGVDYSLIKYVGRGGRRKAFDIYLKRSFLIVSFFSIFVSSLLYFGRDFISMSLGDESLVAIIPGVAVSVMPFTFGFVLSGFFKGSGNPALACLLENGSISMLVAFVLFFLNKLYGYELNGIGEIYAGAAWVVAFVGFYKLYVWRKVIENEAGYDEPCVGFIDFLRVSFSFFISSLANFFQSVVSIFLAGMLLSSSDLGLFKVSQQIGLIAAFSLIVINAIFPPRFSALYYEGKVEELGRLARQGSLIGIFSSLPIFIVCIAFPEFVLSFFGDGFEGAEIALRVICCAQILNVATGSVGFLLNMTGHEKIMRNLTMVSGLVGIGVFWFLIECYGLLGAALAQAFVLVFQNILAALLVKSKLGITTIPGFQWR